MKKVFEEPKITIETFTIEDVITTSGGQVDEDELVMVPKN